MFGKVIEYCQHQLKRSPHSLEYLRHRGITKETIETFQLGYFPFHLRGLFKAADPKWLRTVGIVYDANSSPLINRLTFPIYDVYNKPLAIAGRTLTAQKPKYINNSYNKRCNLYALNYTKNEIRRVDSVIVVEGYFDVIKLYQEDIKNVVATCGTALCDEQVLLLARYSSGIILVYNSDDPGVRAANKALMKRQRAGVRLRSVALPDDTKDVDVYLHKYGKDRFLQLLKLKTSKEQLLEVTKKLKEAD